MVAFTFQASGRSGSTRNTFMGFYRDKKRGDWIYRFDHQGKHYGGRGFKTKAAARSAREEHRKQLQSALKMTPSGLLSVSNDYLQESQRRHAKKTFKNKLSRIKGFLAFLGKDMPVDTVTSLDVDRYLKTRPTNNNFNVHRKELHALFHFAKKRKLIRDNPVSDIEKMPHTPARKVIPTEEQVVKLIMAADPVTEQPLLLTILHTLARVDEILRLTWEDVNFDKRELTLWTRKRKGGAYEPDAMAMNQDLYNVLKRQYDRRTENPFVFVNPKTGTRYNRRPKMMAGLCRRAFDPTCKSIKKYTGPRFGFHHLRHFGASLLADSGKFSIKTLQDMLRHKEGRTTEIYLHSIGDGKREAAKALEGRFMVSGDGVGSGDTKGNDNAKDAM